MKPDIIVDISAWIDYFNKPNSKIGKAVEKIIKQEKALIAGVILTELLQGVRVPEEFDALLDSMLAIPVLETGLNTWISLKENCVIFTLDHHFKKIPGIHLFQN